MILDYNYNKKKSLLSVSYINEDGNKKILDFNVNRFKTYYSNPTGRYSNWDGTKCDIRYTDNPSTFDIKTYFEEMPDTYKKLLRGKTAPRLYTFDIETEEGEEFPHPSQAKYPITNISIANDKCSVIVLGTRGITEEELDWINEQFRKYMEDCKFFKGLGLETPKFQYVKFDSEEAMLTYFLKNIVSKVPLLAGWNSILFDWQYIQNRIRGYYPNISFSSCSANYTLSNKNYKDLRDDKVSLSMPNHTLILDMMDVVGTFDMVVLPIKESLSLDYISRESIGVTKIKYKGSLQDLYDNDYPRYVFYNAIDSVLVQLIDKRFKTLQNIYTQALYCKERIGSCFSKIALTEALFFNYFYEKNIKVVSSKEEERHRGVLIGAYVRKPTPGKHDFVCCNDFASLYPSTIITCNMSIENFVGTFYDEEQLLPYKNNKKDYIVVGANVHKNKGTLAKPELGDFIKRCLLEDELDVYRKDKNYFVSINGSVYKNDKTYAFKDIQATLKANRNTGKYLAKQLEAMVVSDIDHILNGQKITNQQYPENITRALKSLGYEVDCTEKLNGHNLIELRDILKKEIEFNTSFEQAMKLLGNSMYGGSSHVAFFWFNITLANDITGEARNIIHRMESHIPKYMEEQWPKMKEFHKKYGIELKQEFNQSNVTDCLSICYGDTDSLYISYKGLIDSIKDNEKLSIEDKTKIIVDLNTGFLDEHNREFMKEYYEGRFVESVQNFELETVALSGVWLDVKKRYAQLLLWKDGKTFDINKLPMKTKGLEIVKSSYPRQARESLMRLVRYLLEDQGGDMLLQRLNIEMQKEKTKFFQAPLEEVCGNVSVQNYTKYIISDTDPLKLKVMPKCPSNVRALGNYNRLRNIHNLPGDPIYGGKVKWYKFLPVGATKRTEPEFFAFVSGDYPDWADKYAPINKGIMFQQFVLDPFNRILNAIEVGELRIDGNIQTILSLF